VLRVQDPSNKEDESDEFFQADGDRRCASLGFCGRERVCMMPSAVEGISHGVSECYRSSPYYSKICCATEVDERLTTDVCEFGQEVFER
jgi:hypothetical protein